MGPPRVGRPPVPVTPPAAVLYLREDIILYMNDGSRIGWRRHLLYPYDGATGPFCPLSRQRAILEGAANELPIFVRNQYLRAFGSVRSNAPQMQSDRSN